MLTKAEKIINKTDYDVIQKSEPTVPDREKFNLGFLELLSEGVIVIDAERRVVGVNSAFEQLLGWSESELVGRPCHLFFGCKEYETGNDFCETLCPLANLRIRQLKKDTVHYQDMSMSHKNGQRLVVNVSLSPLELALPDKAVTADSYSIMVLRNVTDTKKQERIQSEFITAASHQLRTPLSSIKTSIGLLLGTTELESNPILQRLLKNIQTSSLRMERLVNDLIELVSLQNGQVKMQPQVVEAQELLLQAIKLNRQRLEARNQLVKPVQPAEPLYVKADFLRISQVLGHLLSNASKFSQSGQKIKLEIASRPSGTGGNNTGADEVVFSVKDEGIGIAREEQPFIFEKFYQAQVIENTAELGAGLGLPLAKVLIELNNGRLWFESEPGKGSTFYFSLPAARP
ncbi:MAG: PAS domain-containing sensor histidine kinase [Chloroflexi bacterium]|nr:PAS domain-containing sensor histidine kinase [Chloroflexota bacterium]